MTSNRVAGADIVKKRGWVVVVLDSGRHARSLVVSRLADIVVEEPEISRLAVDIPIGLPNNREEYLRRADKEAKTCLGNAGSPVFYTLPRPVYECSTKESAHARMMEICGSGLHPFGWALQGQIVEADDLALHDDRVIEAHPEVTFWSLNGGKLLGSSKKSWNGQHLRRKLLKEVGVVFPEILEEHIIGGVPPDDILDAAAAAWTAHRFNVGVAEYLGEPSHNHYPNVHAGRIWY